MAFGSEQWMYNAGGGFYPHEIGNSIRFDTNAYLSRTPSSSGNRKTWTWSAWVKRGNLGSTESLFGAYTDSNNRLYLHFGPSNTIKMFGKAGGTTSVNFESDALFRDASSWYHVTLVMDTTQATASSRTKLYVNGLQQTITFSTTPSLNSEPYINAAAAHLIGDLDGSVFFNGYMAEVNFVDGQALDASYFGETKSGVWIPKRYSGTYGTNGFHLDFATRATDPIDASGNGNNWSSVNVVSTDWMLDSPTNNFATLNPLWSTRGTLSEGNLKNTTTGSGRGTRASTFAASSGKYYCEILYTDVNVSLPAYARIGVIRSDSSYSETANFTSAGFNGIGYVSVNGDLDANGSTTNTGGATYTDGDIVGIALDMDANEVSFYKNGTLQYSAVNPSSVLDNGSWMFVCADSSNTNNSILHANFGQDSSFAGTKTRQGNTDANGIGDFYYAPPADYLALCSANLPDPAIDPAEDDIPADYFNPVLYTGNGSTQSITGVGFQPDWVWIKERSSTSSHSIFDQVRGPQKYLASNTTSAEGTSSSQLTAFDADGFTTGASGGTNQSGQTYAAWNWKAGGSAVANTDGTIASQVSANPKAGFSVVTIGGLPASTLSTFGHGLGVKPDMVILKSRNNATNWEVYHSSLTPDGEKKLYLNDTTAEIDSGFMGDTPPTSSVVSFNPGGSASNHVAYCFHSVEGFSKFGSYTGNGSTDGPFVYTGFRPAFVMWKNASDVQSWHIYDAKRSEYNLANKVLYANLSNAEGTSSSNVVDLLSNGFKLRGNNIGSNASGDTYIFMAFAEMPYKYANAR